MVTANDDHLGTQNAAQWGGRWWQGEPRADFATNNITAISADMKNLGNTPLEMRMVITSGNGGGGRWISTNAVRLEPGTDWPKIYWILEETNWTRAGDSGIFSKMLPDVGRISFHHDPGDPNAHGGIPDITAALGIDNVAAVPEPGMASVVALTTALLTSRRRR